MEDDISKDATAAPPRGFLALLGDIYLAPGAAFREIARHPTVLVPALLLVLAQLAFMGIWLSQMNLMEFLRNQSAQAGRPMPPMEAGGRIATVMQVSMMASAVVVPLLGLLAGAAVFLVIYNFVLGATASYRQYLSLIAWSVAATTLVTTPLLLLTMMLKGDWNVSPDTVLATNLGAFLNVEQVPRWLHGLAKRLDIVTLWLLFLLATGLGHATRRSTASAAVPLVGLWLVIVLVLVAVGSIA